MHVGDTLYGTKWWPINFGPIAVSTACSATRRLEDEQGHQQRRGLEYQYEEHQFQESKGCAKDLKVSKVVVHDKWTRVPAANDIALLWLAEDVPDCLIETGEVREHCESYVGTGESPPCWPEKVKKRYSPIVAVDSPTLDFANYALENDAQTGKVFAGLRHRGRLRVDVDAWPLTSLNAHATTIYETGPFGAVGVYGYFFGPTEIGTRSRRRAPTSTARTLWMQFRPDNTATPGRAGLCPATRVDR